MAEPVSQTGKAKRECSMQKLMLDVATKHKLKRQSKRFGNSKTPKPKSLSTQIDHLNMRCKLIGEL
jgi:hypothetical protein